MQLDEAFEYLKFNIKQFEEFTTGEERVMHVYKEIPDEATTIDRLWPTELMNKDSRIRRELSARGRESFSCKDYDETLGKEFLKNYCQCQLKDLVYKASFSSENENQKGRM